MSQLLQNFGQSAKDLSKNPLGIIALFIVLVYGFACSLFGFSAKHLLPDERYLLVCFTVGFPTLVLIAFVWLVSRHPDKLYGPGDFRNDDSYLKTLNQSRSAAAAPDSPDNRKAVEEMMKFGGEFTVVKMQEDRIKADLSVKNLSYADTTAQVLIRHLAVSQTLHFFDNTYHTIFGTQIKLLRQLDQTPQGLGEPEIQNHFLSAKNANPGAYTAWDVRAYMGFLQTSNLVQTDGKTYQITNLGKEFLIWLAKSGKTEARAL
jgi:hypothetical protein